MTITIKLFALLRDQAGGLDHLPLVLPPGATVANAIEALATQFPQLQKSLPKAAAALNLNKTPRDTPLNDGDELALLPPVSGG